MTEIQRLLTATIDDLNTREKRDNRPRFSISFIRKHPGLFVAMYAAWLATLIVMLKSETLVDSVWLLVVLFVVFNAFFFFDVNPRYRRTRFPRVLQRGVVQHALRAEGADRQYPALAGRRSRAKREVAENGHH